MSFYAAYFSTRFSFFPFAPLYVVIRAIVDVEDAANNTTKFYFPACTSARLVV
jgi:hypothetical protein